MLQDLIQAGFFGNCTEAIIEGILRLYEDLSTTESEVNMRLKMTRGDYNNLKRLAQLEGGTEEIWAERLILLYALEHAKALTEEADQWESVFKKKRELEERTEGLTELRHR
jgi:hypothetical protein